MHNNICYVYGLFAPGRAPELFYIGKGKGDRMRDHFRPSGKGKNPHKDNVMAKYPGCYPKILFDNLTEEEAFAIEVSAIAQTEGLTNLTNGGEGASGRMCTAETKAKMSEAMVGEKNHMYGKTHSNETKAKLSEARRRLQAGENHPMYGKKHSAETKTKMSEALVGEKNPRAKLTWDQVHEIRERLAAGEKGSALAKEFWVRKTTISGIKNNKIWRKVEVK